MWKLLFVLAMGMFLAFPAALAFRWMPGLLPEDPA